MDLSKSGIPSYQNEIDRLNHFIKWMLPSKHKKLLDVQIIKYLSFVESSDFGEAYHRLTAESVPELYKKL